MDEDEDSSDPGNPEVLREATSQDRILAELLTAWRAARARVGDDPSPPEAKERWLWQITGSVLGELQRRTGDPAIRDVLGFVVAGLNGALDGLPVRALCAPGGNRPTWNMRFAQAMAVAYARLAKSKQLLDRDWQETICKVYGIQPETLKDWETKSKRYPPETFFAHTADWHEQMLKRHLQDASDLEVGNQFVRGQLVEHGENYLRHRIMKGRWKEKRFR